VSLSAKNRFGESRRKTGHGESASLLLWGSECLRAGQRPTVMLLNAMSRATKKTRFLKGPSGEQGSKEREAPLPDEGERLNAHRKGGGFFKSVGMEATGTHGLPRNFQRQNLGEKSHCTQMAKRCWGARQQPP